MAFTSLFAPSWFPQMNLYERDSFSEVKYCKTPFTEGASAIGFVVSMTVLPLRLQCRPLSVRPRPLSP